MKHVVFGVALVLMAGCHSGNNANSPTAVASGGPEVSSVDLTGLWTGSTTVARSQVSEDWACPNRVPAAGSVRQLKVEFGGSSDKDLTLTVSGNWAGSPILLQGALANGSQLTASQKGYLEIKAACGVQISLRAQVVDNDLTGAWKSTLYKPSGTSYAYDENPVGEVDETFELHLTR